MRLLLFPVLRKLQSSYPDYIINTFDEWLGTRRLATIKTLSPLQFSTDTGIDDNVAINLFLIAVSLYRITSCFMAS